MSGEGLDRAAVRRRAEAAALPLRDLSDLCDLRASAVDVPALLDALEAAEAVADQLACAIRANGPWGRGLSPGQTAVMDALDAYAALRTEGGAS